MEDLLEGSMTPVIALLQSLHTAYDLRVCRALMRHPFCRQLGRLGEFDDGRSSRSERCSISLSVDQLRSRLYHYIVTKEVASISSVKYYIFLF